jgi:hypothetical protein
MREHGRIGIGKFRRRRNAPDRPIDDTAPAASGRQRTPRRRSRSPRLRGPLQSRRDIVVRGADFFHLLGNGQRLFRLASDQMIHPLSPEQRHEVLGSINLLGQPLRGSNGLSHFGRRSLWRAPMPAGARFANRVLVAAAGRRFFRSPTITPHHERAEVSIPVRSTKPCRRQCMRTHCCDGASPAAGRQAVAGLSRLAGGLRMRDKPRPLAPGSTF